MPIKRDLVIDQEQCAQLVEKMIKQKPYRDQVWARMALAVAARAIRRGRHLTERERLLNLAQSMEDADKEDGTNEMARTVAKLREIAR